MMHVSAQRTYVADHKAACRASPLAVHDCSRSLKDMEQVMSHALHVLWRWMMSNGQNLQLFAVMLCISLTGCIWPESCMTTVVC